MAEPHPDNVSGPFYVENGCCLSCGIPEGIAPEIFTWAPDQSHCFVSRQPETEDETDRTLRALLSAEVECIRYRGYDIDVRRRIAEFGSGHCCDEPLPGVRPVLRDRVAFRSAHAGDDPLALAERLRTYLAEQDAAQAATMRDYFRDENVALEERVRTELINKDWHHYSVRTPRFWNRHVAIFAWDAGMGWRPHYNRVAFHKLADEARFGASISAGFFGSGWSLALMVHDWLSEVEMAGEIEWKSSQGPGPHSFRNPI